TPPLFESQRYAPGTDVDLGGRQNGTRVLDLRPSIVSVRLPLRNHLAVCQDTNGSSETQLEPELPFGKRSLSCRAADIFDRLADGCLGSVPARGLGRLQSSLGTLAAHRPDRAVDCADTGVHRRAL